MNDYREPEGAPAPRKKLDHPVELTFEDSHAPVPARTRNMSSTGMLVLAEGEGRRGQFIRFDFAALSGTGEVIWTRDHEDGGTLLGIRFVSMSSGGRRALARLLREG